MQFAETILDLVGNTPLVRLSRVTRDLGPIERRPLILAKLEMLNPGGSVKDRIGLPMIEAAEQAGLLKPGGTIIEPTSGNTGHGLAIAAALKGYRCIFVMPDKMSQEKILNLRAFGARVVVCPTAVEPEDPRSYYQVAKRIANETTNCFYANQYHNPANPEAHYISSGPAIWRQTNGELDVFMAGMGTGGTLSGAGKFLKEKISHLIKSYSGNAYAAFLAF
jgi:cystathionine beta-synthase